MSFDRARGIGASTASSSASGDATNRQISDCVVIYRKNAARREIPYQLRCKSICCRQRCSAPVVITVRQRAARQLCDHTQRPRFWNARSLKREFERRLSSPPLAWQDQFGVCGRECNQCLRKIPPKVLTYRRCRSERCISIGRTKSAFSSLTTCATSYYASC